MTHPEHIQLMHLVLDGEATPGEAQELARLLAADPAARAQYDELQRLFDGLKSVPEGVSARGAGSLGNGRPSARMPPAHPAPASPRTPTFLAVPCNWSNFHGSPGCQSGKNGNGPSDLSGHISGVTE